MFKIQIDSLRWLRELLGAVDETKDGDYLAFVVGDDQSIARNAKRLPPHMSRIRYPSELKKAVAQDLDLKGNILVYCIKYGLPTLKCMIAARKSSRAIRIPGEKINRKIAYEVNRTIQINYGSFAASRGIDLREITFEVDNNVIGDYFRICGYATAEPRQAHRIADCVAYSNDHSWKISNVVEYGLDFQRIFHNNIMDKLV